MHRKLWINFIVWLGIGDLINAIKFLSNFRWFSIEFCNSLKKFYGIFLYQNIENGKRSKNIWQCEFFEAPSRLGIRINSWSTSCRFCEGFPRFCSTTAALRKVASSQGMRNNDIIYKSLKWTNLNIFSRLTASFGANRVNWFCPHLMINVWLSQIHLIANSLC